MNIAFFMIPATVLRRISMFLGICALGFLVGCQSVQYARIYKPFEDADNFIKNFEQVKAICSGEAQSVLFKQDIYIPPTPCYFEPCFEKPGTLISGGPKEYFSQAKYDSCVAKHGWRFSHKTCVENCENADAESQFHLGASYYKGEDVPQNDKEAANWFRRAADKGLGQAQAALGLLYAEGRGVPQNFREAYIWFSIAESNGVSDTSKPRSEAAEHLADSELPAIKAEIRRRLRAIRNKIAY